MANYITTLQDKDGENGLLPKTVLKAIADDNGDYISNAVTADDINAISLLRGLVIKEIGTGYIQFENGFQICWGTSQSTNSGSTGTEGDSVQVNFGKAFISAPSVVMQPTGYAGSYYSVGLSASTGSFNFATKTNHSFPGGTITQAWIAIGKWK